MRKPLRAIRVPFFVTAMGTMLVASTPAHAVSFEVGPGKPYTTIQSAVNAAATLDDPAAPSNTGQSDPVDIVVFEGTYVEHVSIPADAAGSNFDTENDGWTIRANPGDRVLIKGGISVGLGRDNMVFDGINVQLVNRAGYAFGNTARSNTVRNAIIYGGNATASGFAGINNNFLFGTNNFEHLTIFNNTFGIVSTNTSTWTLTDSIVSHSNSYGVGQFGGNNNTISYSNLFNSVNCFSESTFDDCSSFTDGGNNLNWDAGLDPLYYSTTSSDPQFLWLAGNSPCFDTGSSTGSFTDGQMNMGALPAVNPLPPGHGACCDALTGDCEPALEADCNGTFHGVGTLCAQVTCPFRFIPADCDLSHGLQTISMTRFAENPIVDISQSGDPTYPLDSLHVLHQCVRRKDASSPYMMWYTGQPQVPEGGFSERRIFLATSDDGIHFTKQGVVLAKTPSNPLHWDGVQVHMPAVIWHEGQWMMWYVGHNNSGSPGWYTIGLATSPDGFTWTKVGQVFRTSPDPQAFDYDTVREPTVVFDETDGLFKMWYNGTNVGEHFGPTGYATSPDGINWTRIAQVSDNENFLRGGVIKVGSYFYMFYNINATLGYATSRDGIEWLAYDQNPFMVPTSSSWESAYLQAPSLHYDESTDTLWMYYNAFNGNERIGGATTPFLSIPLPETFVGDYDGDGDADMNDYGFLQSCLGQSVLFPTIPGCASANLNCDFNVNALDIELFRNCLSGPGVPVDPACRN